MSNWSLIFEGLKIEERIFSENFGRKTVRKMPNNSKCSTAGRNEKGGNKEFVKRKKHKVEKIAEKRDSEDDEHNS